MRQQIDSTWCSPCPYCDGSRCEECDGTGERWTTVLDRDDQKMRIHGSRKPSAEDMDALRGLFDAAVAKMGAK